jgi:hypothetical protein
MPVCGCLFFQRSDPLGGHAQNLLLVDVIVVVVVALAVAIAVAIDDTCQRISL